MVKAWRKIFHKVVNCKKIIYNFFNFAFEFYPKAEEQVAVLVTLNVNTVNGPSFFIFEKRVKCLPTS